jgi:hypothetical protein
MNDDFHGYFNINRAMVDDLYELIVTRKRAEERSSRLKLNGGEFFEAPLSSLFVLLLRLSRYLQIYYRALFGCPSVETRDEGNRGSNLRQLKGAERTC